MKQSAAFFDICNKTDYEYDIISYDSKYNNECTINFCYNTNPIDNCINIGFLDDNKIMNGFRLLSEYPQIARFYMGRPQPSKRATEIAILTLLGYKKIKFNYEEKDKNIFDIDMMLFRVLKKDYQCVLESNNDIISIINKMYFPCKKNVNGNFAYITYFSGRYVIGAYVLCLSLRRFTNRKIIVLYSSDDDLSLFDNIVNVELVKCDKIKNMYSEKQKRFEDVMTKLNIFSIYNYDKLIYIDSDCVVNKNIDFLFSLPEGFYACPDWGLSYGTDFNSGMLIYTPSEKLKEYVFSNINKVSSNDGGDQGFLNILFKKDVIFLPPEFNTLKRVYIEHPNVLNIKDSFVIHYVGIKPWDFHILEKFEELNKFWYKCIDMYGYCYLSHMSKIFISRRIKKNANNVKDVKNDIKKIDVIKNKHSITKKVKKLILHPIKFFNDYKKNNANK